MATRAPQTAAACWDDGLQSAAVYLSSRNVLFMNAIRKAPLWELNNKVENMVEIRMLCRTSNSNDVQMFARKEAWTCTRIHF